jgi:hypothetical protein
MKYQFFPRSQGMINEITEIVKCFENIYHEINSAKYNLSSNEVLEKLYKPLTEIGFKVEKGKKSSDKIRIPVLFGLDNNIDKEFNADALSNDGKIVVEIEAGRAVDNNQFLKDIFRACMMFGVEYLVIAVRKEYRGRKDFDIIFTFLETLYISNRLHLPLKGILLIGY